MVRLAHGWLFGLATLVAAAVTSSIPVFAQATPDSSTFTAADDVVVDAGESPDSIEAWEASLEMLGDDAVQCDCESCKAEAAAQGKPIAGCKTCCHGHSIDWSKYPATIRPMPRLGFAPLPPTQGPAYFSAWDHLTGECRQAPPKSGYAPTLLNANSYFDNDWRFVEGIDPCERNFVERLKRIHLNDCLMFSTGGSYWYRYMDEHNSRLTTVDNEYTQHRLRLYGDVSYSDWLRVYGEYLYGDSFGETLAPLPIDVDRGDLLNMFADVKLFEYQCKPVYVRGGRQELLYGSQRLITPLEWANTRRTFDGVKVFRQGEKWDYDAFWVQPVIPNGTNFNAPDEHQNLVGSWLTYRREKGEFLDFYYLALNNSNSVTQQGIVRAPFHNHTFGSRWAGDEDGWLWDFEGMLQIGEQNHSDLLAGAATAGLGRNWKEAALNPTAWIYYDYASGDGDPTAGDAHTFNQLFAFGHYYMGWMDLIGRQNIHDVNAHLYLYPAPWITVWGQYHHFWLDQSTDALYNPAGVAYRRDPTGLSGNNVGDEIGLTLNFHLARYTDILVSYNKLYGGGFLAGTAGPGGAVDAESLYLMFGQRW